MMIPVQRLAEVMHRGLAIRGLSLEHATVVVGGLLQASRRGIATHGIRLFPVYVAELDGGRAVAQPTFQWTTGKPAARRLDARGALGLVAGMVAEWRGCATGSSAWSRRRRVANSNHFGAASTYTIDMARRGVFGICCSNSDALMAPFGGMRPLFGTNPLSIAAYGGDGDLFAWTGRRVKSPSLR